MTRALQKMIHVGCRELRIDSDARHALQLEVCGKTSMSDMTEADLKMVIERLKKDGFTVQSNTKKRPAAPRADLRYVHVLWGLLGKAGKLQKPGRDGLNAFVRSRFEHKWQSVPIDIDSLRNGGQINDITRALKDWCARENIPDRAMNGKLHITDHAVLCYLERVKGVDVKAARADIARRMEIAEGHDCLSAVVSDGFRYKIRGRSVVTVLFVGAQAGKP